ncbi:hypothetical protein C1589_004476 [Escherichia coli]|nr:hypothetical protein [Escherichia coli]
MNLILSAPVKEMTEAFKRVFANADNVNIVGKPFEAIREFDCMVSAANSFGLMDGGVDAAITAFFGTQLQSRVQNHIICEYLGEQPVGWGARRIRKKSYAKVFRASVRAETSRLPVCGSAARRNRRLG